MATTAQTGGTTKKTTAKAACTTGSTKTKPTAKKVVARTPSVRSVRANGGAKARPVDSDQRRSYIEVAAYFIAERRGFSEGHEAEDWAAAEAEIDRLLAEGRLNG